MCFCFIGHWCGLSLGVLVISRGRKKVNNQCGILSKIEPYAVILSLVVSHSLEPFDHLCIEVKKWRKKTKGLLERQKTRMGTMASIGTDTNERVERKGKGTHARKKIGFVQNREKREKRTEKKERNKNESFSSGRADRV